MSGPLDDGTGPESPADLDAEIRFHLERRVEQLVEEGWPEVEAREEALRRFGDVDWALARMRTEDRRRRLSITVVRVLDSVRLDLAHAAAQWRRAPGVVGMVLLTLALGIGATTAIFSVVDGVLVRPLPFPAPERLVAVWSDWTERGGPEREWFGWPDLEDVRDEVSAFEEVSIWSTTSRTLTERGAPVQLAGIVATHGTLERVLRVQPHLGRFFTPEEDAPGGPAAVVVSHEFWTTTLGAASDALGSNLVLNGEPHEIVGVLEPGMAPPFGPATPQDIWITPRVDGTQVADTRGNASWRSIARLQPGSSLEAANEELRALGAKQRELYPGRYEGRTPRAWDLRKDLTRATAPGMRLVFAAVGLVLLLAGFNVANLLLARNSMRTDELAVRAALGAGRARLVRQLLVETGALAVMGGVLGAALGWVGTRALVAVAPQGTPRIEAVALDGRVLLFTAVVTVATALGAGLAPALKGGGRDPKAALGDRAGGADRAGLRLRSGLVSGQVALAVALLATAGVLGRSFQQLRSVDLGFDPSDVMTFRISLPPGPYDDPEARAAFQEEVAARLRTLPGVADVGAVSALPLADFNGDVTYNIEGRPLPEPGDETAAWIRRVVPGYMSSMDLRMVAGRGITASDARGGTPVAVINETLAGRQFPDENPIGRRIGLGSPEDPLWFDIVGVVSNVRNFDVRDDWRDAVYFSNAQFPTASLFFTLEMAPGMDPTSALGPARAAIQELDGSLALVTPRAMSDLVAVALGPDRFLALLLGSFAGLALSLALVGLYGVVSHSVAARMREVGVRMALGADRGQIRALVLARGLVPVGVGVGAGLLLTLVATRLTSAVLFGTSPVDPLSVGASVLALFGTATLATLVPAIRAARSDPARVLRRE